MQLGQSDPTSYQTIVSQLTEGQHRLDFLEEQMKFYKKLMGVLTVISLMIVLLNRNCGKKNGRKERKAR